LLTGLSSLLVVCVCACGRQPAAPADAKGGGAAVSPPPAAGNEVIVLCGGSMRAAMEEIIKRYAAGSADKVMATYGDSGDICAQIVKTGRGDIFLCHDPFMPWAAEKGVIATWAPLAYFNLVIVVPKGNPRQIHGLADLAKPGLRVGVGDMTYSTAGQIVKQVLRVRPYGSNVLQNIVMENKGHPQRCNDVAMGTLDAATVWDAVAALYTNKLESMPIDLKGVDAITSATYRQSDVRRTAVTIGLVKGAELRPAAKRFYDFAIQEGPAIMAEKGFARAPAQTE
jgi:molybdate transport system substrate-binding protein